MRRRWLALGILLGTACGLPDTSIEHFSQTSAELRLGLSAHAGSKDGDRLRELQEKAAERAREMAERAREQAERAAERAREQAERAAERARAQAEQAKQQAESSRSQSGRDVPSNKSDDNSSSGATSSSTSAASSSTKSNSADNADKPSKTDNASGKSDRKAAAADKDDVDVSPPDSIAEWWRRLNGSGDQRAARAAPATPTPAGAPAKKAAEAGKPAGVAPAAGKAMPAAAQQQPVAAAKKTPPKTPHAGPLDPLPFHSRAADILAINPSPAAIARAKALGFTAQQSTSLPQLDMSVTRLTPPAGMDAATAKEALGRQVPDANLSLNQIYHPIKAASEREAAGAMPHTAPRPAGSGGCNKERCYGMAAIRWQPALQTCTSGIRIGIVDTTVDQRHPSLRDGILSKRIDVKAFAGEGRQPAASAHGTSIISLLAGAPHSGTPGLAPEARYFAADIFHADANGQPLADSLSLLRALNWMEKEGVKIVNMSVAGPHDEAMERAIEKLARNGVIFVAAAGNEGPTSPPVYPAAYRNVIAVTAVGKDLRGYRQANRGDYIDLAAPGVDVWAAVPDARENFQSGTSFAVPFATAVLASVYGQVEKKSKEAMLAALEYKDLGLPGRDPVYGRGLVLAPQNCTAAPVVEVARSSPGPSFSTPPAGVGASSLTFGFASGKP